MSFELPDLPFDRRALEPVISAETIDYHYGKHHRAYVDNVNQLTAGTEWASRSLEDLIRKADGGIFNNAAQVWNHTFYWSGLSPRGGGCPQGTLADRLGAAFGGFEEFKAAFTRTAVAHFGSGWAWLVRGTSGDLSVTSTANAGCPLAEGAVPLLTCDVWEHAYYIDYRNARPAYVEKFWELVDWDAVADRLGE
jgi:Fe-Mn family superoxide dismutase